MKKQILIFTLIFATVVATAFFVSCVTTEHHAEANFPAVIKTKIGTFLNEENLTYYLCKTKRKEADMLYSVNFCADSSRRELDAAFKRIEELALSLDENEEKIISFAAKKVGRKPEDFCIYGIEICLPSPENSVRNPIHYQLYDKCDEYGCPLYVLCDENGNSLVALFVG